MRIRLENCISFIRVFFGDTFRKFTIWFTKRFISLKFCGRTFLELLISRIRFTWFSRYFIRLREGFGLRN